MESCINSRCTQPIATSRSPVADYTQGCVGLAAGTMGRGALLLAAQKQKEW